MQWLRLWDPPDGDVLNRPLIIGAIEETLGNFRDYFQGDIDEMRISDIPREPWEFQLVDFGVEVTSILPEIVNFQEGLTFTIYVPYGLASAGISLLYRPGGGNIYQRLAGTQLDTVTYEIEIPPESISLRGLEYYIEVYVNNDTLTHPIMDPRSNPIAEIVRHEGEMEAPISFHFQQFKMFSIPFGLDVSSALSV